MGAKQSSSPPPVSAAANGRTRAYSGSDLPTSTASSNGGSSSRSSAAAATTTTAAGVSRYHSYGPSSASGATSGSGHRISTRARSVGGGSGTRSRSGINIPSSSGAYSSPESEGSSPEEAAAAAAAAAAGRRRSGGEGPRLLIGSLPAHLSPNLFGGFKCPVCSKFVPSDEMDLHLVLCLTKPRVTYNEDVLTKDTGECAICLEDLEQGDTIARLPCLCIYHKSCIDEWFEVNRSCPEHPSD